MNENILPTCSILKLVAASAVEAELEALFLNAQEPKIIILILEELGHPHPPTLIHVTNTLDMGTINNVINRQQSRDIE